MEDKKGTGIVKREVWIGVAAGITAVAVIAGIFMLVANVLGGKPSSRTDVWDDDDTESSYYRENPEGTTTTRETQGRDYYENGGYKGMDSYYIIQDLSTDEIIAVYEYYNDLAHTYEISELKDFDKELEHPAHSQIDARGNGVFMFYDLIMPDEHIDHVVSFDAEGDDYHGTIAFSMKIRIHDEDKAMEIYNTFVDRYSEGSQGSEFYNMLKTYDKGVRITVNDSESRTVCYKKCKSNGYYYWLIYVSEDY